MMNADNARRIAALLRETGSAHGVYEEGVLGGVRDEEWAAWYADYLMAHGFAALLGRPLTAAETRDALIACDEAYRAAPQTLAWPEAYAARLIALGA